MNAEIISKEADNYVNDVIDKMDYHIKTDSHEKEIIKCFLYRAYIDGYISSLHECTNDINKIRNNMH